MKKKILENYNTYAIFTILMWGLTFLATQKVLASFSPEVAGLVRYGIASCFLGIVALVKKIKPPKGKDLPLTALAGVLGFFVYIICFNHAGETLTAATSSVVMATVPVITACFCRIVYKESLKRHQWLAIGMEFLSILILMLVGGVFSANVGLFWIAACAFLQSAYNTTQKKLTNKYSSLTVVTYSIFFGTLCYIVFIPKALEEIPKASASSWIAILFLGIFASALAYLSWAKAFSLAPKSTYVSNYMFITPFISTFVGFAVAGEIPDLSAILGAVAVILGILLFHKESLRRKGTS